jgi:hypothetical protein
MSGARQIPDALRSLGCRRVESAASTGPRPALCAGEAEKFLIRQLPESIDQSVT